MGKQLLDSYTLGKIEDHKIGALSYFFFGVLIGFSGVFCILVSTIDSGVPYIPQMFLVLGAIACVFAIILTAMVVKEIQQLRIAKRQI